MSITFPCACGVTLSVREDPPVYFVRCPKCQATNKVPHPKKKKAADDPGFEVVDETRPRSTAYDRQKKTDEEWEATPYEKPKAKGGYGLGEEDRDVKRSATRGSSGGDPYEVTQEEFEAEERRRTSGKGRRKFYRALGLVVIAAVGLGAFALVGRLTTGFDAGGKGVVGARMARAAIVVIMLVCMFVWWLVNWLGEEE